GFNVVLPAATSRARPGPVLSAVVDVLPAAAIAHPRDRMMRPVSVADMGLSRLIVVVAAATLWPLVGCAPVGRWHGLAGFASRRRARAATRRLGGWRLFALPGRPGRPGRPGSTGALGDRL